MSGARPTSERIIEVVRRARKGDRRAFAELVEHFRGPVHGYVEALLRDPWAADDATQETFFVMWRHIGDLRDARSFRPWLFRIAEHEAMSGWRRRRRARERSMRDDDGLDIMPTGVSESLSTEGWSALTPDRPEMAALRRAVDELPGIYGEVLAMHYIDQLSCSEIGDTLGLGAGNVRVRLHRARNALRRRLEEDGVDESALGTASVSPGISAGGRRSPEVGVLDDDCRGDDDDDDDDLPVAVPVGAP